ncbi:phage holin family protein [Streptomyces sp. AK08-02]|uniref:phage holin family protein n=1 Tax=Streptomyces sp. AK08-02 TaxID=3028654 RepID=UPI0029BBE3BE|nr:phage holin family protein [Streptomyces sp. AK08-02]MDX3746340.1 phage holin family protein [Streptomyces sp. AK08-02]
MDRIDHLEHLDKHLVDELARVAREAVRDELREQTRKQRRTAALYATSGAVALYAGAALALALGLGLATGLPDWAAALITAVVLGALAYSLRNMARPGPSRTHPPAGSVGAAADPPVSAPAKGFGVPVPPVPPAAPNATAPGTPARDGIDPEGPHHRP